MTVRTFAILGSTAAFSLVFAGCGDEDVCARFTETCIGVELRSPAGESLSVDQVGFFGVEGFDFGEGVEARSPETPRIPAAALPVRVPVLPPPQFAGRFRVAVRGFVAGVEIGETAIEGSVGVGQHLSIVALLERTDAAAPDLAGLDLAGRDLSRPDLARTDLAEAGDLAGTRTCDPFQQNCPAGEQCSVPGGVLPEDESICLPDGTRAVGDVCDAASDTRCEKGALCLADRSAGFGGICRQMCDVQFEDDYCTLPPGPGGAQNSPHCQRIEFGTSIGLCTTPCNPVTSAGASGCPAGSRCFYQPRVFNEITDCNTINGTLTDGQSCTLVVDCAPGFGCMQVGATSSYACREVCRYGMNSDCHTSGYVCTKMPFYAAPLFGFCCPAAGC